MLDRNREKEKEIFSKIKNLSYTESLMVLRDAYGPVPFKYGDKRNSRFKTEKLVVHHVQESFIPSLSLNWSTFQKLIWYVTEIKKVKLRADTIGVNRLKKLYKEYQKPMYLVYCPSSIHKLLHKKIWKEYPEMKRCAELLTEMLENSKNL